MKSAWVFLGMVAVSAAGASDSVAESRHALVIGNSGYEHVRQLENPRNDAMAVAAALGKLGFKVTASLDAGRDGMGEALAKFASGIEEGGVAMVYFAGHGVQIDGQNYLVPVDAKMADGESVDAETLAMERVLESLKQSGSALNLLVLDCCRDNPFSADWNSVVSVSESKETEAGAPGSGEEGKATRNIAAGLQQPKEMPQGMFIAFATSPGKVAEDGEGFNSPYTAALIEEIEKPGVPFEMVFKAVGARVAQQTNGGQEPWFNSKFYGNFYFVAGQAGSPMPEGGVIGHSVTPALAGAIGNGAGAAEIPARGYFDLTEIFDGTSYDEYNYYARQQVVKEAQEKLKAGGFYAMVVDGETGMGTHGAIVKWQETQGLPPTGQLDEASLAKMGLTGIAESSAPAPKPQPRVLSSGGSRPPSSSSRSGEGSSAMSFEEFQRKAREMRQ